MSIIAILTSPASFEGTDEMTRLREVIHGGSGIIHYEVEKHNHIGEALRTFARSGAKALVIIGDKALASATFEFLVEKNPFDGPPPPIAILPAGDNNIVAENLGAVSAVPHRELMRILERHKNGRLLQDSLSLPLMKIEGVYGVGTLYGLFFCAGEIIGQKALFHRGFAPPGLRRRLGHAWRALAVTRKAYLRALKDKNMDKTIRINVNQRGAVVGRFFMVMLTTMNKGLLGAELPEASEGARLNFLSVENTSDAVLKNSRQLVRGRYENRVLPGLVISRVRHVRLVQDGPFILDGSYFEPDKNGELLISATVRLNFILLS